MNQSLHRKAFTYYLKLSINSFQIPKKSYFINETFVFIIQTREENIFIELYEITKSMAL